MEKGACVPVRVHTVVISVQHSDDVSTSQLRKQLMDKVVTVVIPRQYIDSQTVFHLQPSGRFVIGGPQVFDYRAYVYYTVTIFEVAGMLSHGASYKYTMSDMSHEIAFNDHQKLISNS